MDKQSGDPACIGHYELLGEIRRDAWGILYKARDPKRERTVTIKVLPPERLSQKKSVIRFLREAGISAKLDHPNIIKTIALNEEEGSSYIVRECLPGRTLRELIDERKSVDEIDVLLMVKLFRQICQAIEYIHEQGFLHRDMKPESIMVTPDGMVNVTDFRFAILADRHTITGTGAIIGTYAYFSPEQARGEQADSRSDIYSLGAIFFEMLTNKLPFEGTNEVHLIMQHLYSIPEAPTKINPAIPDILDRLIVRALKKLPGERFPRVSEMAGELDSYLAGNA